MGFASLWEVALLVTQLPRKLAPGQCGTLGKGVQGCRSDPGLSVWGLWKLEAVATVHLPALGCTQEARYHLLWPSDRAEPVNKGY